MTELSMVPASAPDSNPSALIALAVQNNADVDKLEKLMDLQERYNRARAKKEFDASKAAFQAECPVLDRAKTVDYTSKKTGGQIKYSYAPLGAIVEQIREPLARHGFSYRFEIDDSGPQIVVSCHLSHTGGHCETNTMRGQPDDSGAKNSIQMRGSTVTYLQRYTLIGVLGLATADADDDGRGAGRLNVEDLIAHNETLRAHFGSVSAIKTSLRIQLMAGAAEAWQELSDEVKRILWRAPSKGGVFTTEERNTMRSAEFRDACGGLSADDPSAQP